MARGGADPDTKQLVRVLLTEETNGTFRSNFTTRDIKQSFLFLL